MALLLDSSLQPTPNSASNSSARHIARRFEPIRPVRIDGWPTAPMPAIEPQAVWRIARGVKIRGEMAGMLDAAIDGEFEGRIQLAGYRLSTGAVSRVHAEVEADTVVVRGEFTGSIVAGTRIVVTRTAKVRGDLTAPSVELADGCSFDGRISRPTYCDEN